MISLLVVVFSLLLCPTVSATDGYGWKEYDSSIWCDVEEHSPIHHGYSTYCTLDMATTTFQGFCEMEYDAKNAYWLYGVGIVEPKGCAGAQYCQSVCWNYIGDQGYGLPPANFTVSNGTFPCDPQAVPMPFAPLVSTPINGSEDAIFCSLSKVGVNTTTGVCRLERNATDGVWSMLSTGVCSDQVCAYTCLFSPQLDSELVFGDFTGATEPGINLPGSLRYDFCALSSYTDDGSLTSSCQIYAHYVPNTTIAWAVVSGPNDCTYVCAEVWVKGHRPNSTTTVLTTTTTTATAAPPPPTTTTTALTTTPNQTTTTDAPSSSSSLSATTSMSSSVNSSTDDTTGAARDSTAIQTVYVPVFVETTPTWVWGAIGALAAAVLVLGAVVVWRLWRARSSTQSYVQLPDTF